MCRGRVECRPLNHHFAEWLSSGLPALAMSVYSILHKPKNEKRQAMLTAVVLFALTFAFFYVVLKGIAWCGELYEKLVARRSRKSKQS